MAGSLLGKSGASQAWEQALRCGLAPACDGRRYQRLGWNAPLAVELPSHFHRQGTFPVDNVGGALTRTEEAAKIGLAQSTGFHPEADCVDSVRRFDRPALSF